MVSVRFMPLYLQMKLYEDIGEHIKVLDCVKQIVNKERKVDSPELYMILREAWRIMGN